MNRFQLKNNIIFTRIFAARTRFWCLLLFCLPGCNKHQGAANTSIVFYNCENFFDTCRVPEKHDQDFSPNGKYHYTLRTYEQKLRNIATVIQSLDSCHPAIIGLAEVENRNVLTALCSQPEISRRHFKSICTDGPDPRGINVGLLYDPAICRILSTSSIPVRGDNHNPNFSTRDILFAQAVIGNDTFAVFVNHWPSRRGGDMPSETGNKRIIGAKKLRLAIDNYLLTMPNGRIIVMGDFNDNPTDSSITKYLAATNEKDGINGTGLFNPWTAIYNGGSEGTEKFGDEWNLFDQILVSGNLLPMHQNRLQSAAATIYKPSFLTVQHGPHKGEPRRSFLGTHWQNGYSDHFPVVLKLVQN